MVKHFERDLSGAEDSRKKRFNGCNAQSIANGWLQGELEYCVELDALKSDPRFQQLLFEVKNTKPLVEALGQAD